MGQQKNHIIISLIIEKTINFQGLFMIKISKKELERYFLYLIKIYFKSCNKHQF